MNIIVALIINEGLILTVKKFEADRTNSYILERNIYVYTIQKEKFNLE